MFRSVDADTFATRGVMGNARLWSKTGIPRGIPMGTLLGRGGEKRGC